MTKPGNNSYQIEYLDSVVKEDIPNLPKTVRETIKRAIEERLMIDPLGFGKPLRYSFKGHRRLRVGDYRIVYRKTAKIYSTIFYINLCLCRIILCLHKYLHVHYGSNSAIKRTLPQPIVAQFIKFMLP